MNNQPNKNPHFSYEERVQIETLLNAGYGVRAIGREINRPKSSVSDEIKYNRVKGIYTAKKAHFKAYQKRWRARYQVLKIAINKQLREYVEEKLQQYWSPENISGRLKEIERQLPYVGKDAIYAYVLSPSGRNLEQFLWYRGQKPRGAVKTKPIAGRTFIDQRPKSVEKRWFFGDWEADFIVSGKNGSGALLVFVERKSRYVLIFKLPDRKVLTINLILAKLCGAQLVVRTLTIDNDVCFRHHEEMSRILGARIFFCYPYHSWEKGGVEKMNQLIRRFIPKKSDISKVSEEKVLWVQNILNHKPLKCLGFQTPAEVVTRSSKLNTFIQVINKFELSSTIINSYQCPV